MLRTLIGSALILSMGGPVAGCYREPRPVYVEHDHYHDHDYDHHDEHERHDDERR
jgi:hypothetical protein